jgi:hypothetical protein
VCSVCLVCNVMCHLMIYIPIYMFYIKVLLKFTFLGFNLLPDQFYIIFTVYYFL